MSSYLRVYLRLPGNPVSTFKKHNDLNRTKSKDLGIWMDHSNASLMEYTSEPVEVITISPQSEAKEITHGSSENVSNNKEKHHQSDFYKRLGDTILHYDSIVLFGPTNAKVELYNILKEDHRFSKIKIEVKPADKMTENQQHAFVKAHFFKKLDENFHESSCMALF